MAQQAKKTAVKMRRVMNRLQVATSPISGSSTLAADGADS
jgi:hypothetical protein